MVTNDIDKVPATWLDAKLKNNALKRQDSINKKLLEKTQELVEASLKSHFEKFHGHLENYIKEVQFRSKSNYRTTGYGLIPILDWLEEHRLKVASHLVKVPALALSPIV